MTLESGKASLSIASHFINICKIPNLNQHVSAHTEQTLIDGTKLDVPDVLFMAWERSQQLQIISLPYFYCFVLACRSYQLIVGRELSRVDKFLVSHDSQGSLVHNWNCSLSL